MKAEELDNILEKSFRTEPDFYLPHDFAQKVSVKVARRSQWKTGFQEYLYLTIVSIFLIGVASGTYYLVNKDLLIQIVTWIRENVSPVISILFLLNFILFADKVLLSLLFSRWSKS